MLALLIALGLTWLGLSLRQQIYTTIFEKTCLALIKTYEGLKQQARANTCYQNPPFFLGSKTYDGIMTRYQILAFVWTFLHCVFSRESPDVVSDSIHCHTMRATSLWMWQWPGTICMGRRWSRTTSNDSWTSFRAGVTQWDGLLPTRPTSSSRRAIAWGVKYAIIHHLIQ